MHSTGRQYVTMVRSKGRVPLLYGEQQGMGVIVRLDSIIRTVI
jgi:hypothetical protein